MSIIYHSSDKMYDVIQEDDRILQIMSRMGLPLGFGEKTVGEVCRENNVDAVTFLALANYTIGGKNVAGYYIDKVSVASLMDYLIRCHHYFLMCVACLLRPSITLRPIKWHSLL